MSEFRWQIFHGKPPQIGDEFETCGKHYYIHEVQKLEGIFTFRCYVEVTDIE